MTISTQLDHRKPCCEEVRQSIAQPATTARSKSKLMAHVIDAMAFAIKELGSVPSGHLYAAMTGALSMAHYSQAIDLMVAHGLVSRDSSHLLTWIG